MTQADRKNRMNEYNERKTKIDEFSKKNKDKRVSGRKVYQIYDTSDYGNIEKNTEEIKKGLIFFKKIKNIRPNAEIHEKV